VGRDPRTTTIVVTVGVAPAKEGGEVLLPVLTDVWNDILVPRLRNRFGADAAVPDVDPPSRT
jgi:hypothetical protein